MAERDGRVVEPADRGVREGGHAGTGGEDRGQVGNTARPQLAGHGVGEDLELGEFAFLQRGGLPRSPSAAARRRRGSPRASARPNGMRGTARPGRRDRTVHRPSTRSGPRAGPPVRRIAPRACRRSGGSRSARSRRRAPRSAPPSSGRTRARGTSPARLAAGGTVRFLPHLTLEPGLPWSATDISPMSVTDGDISMWRVRMSKETGRCVFSSQVPMAG